MRRKEIPLNVTLPAPPLSPPVVAASPKFNVYEGTK